MTVTYVPISDLPSAGALNGSELSVIVQGGVTSKSTLQAQAQRILGTFTYTALATSYPPAGFTGYTAYTSDEGLVYSNGTSWIAAQNLPGVFTYNTLPDAASVNPGTTAYTSDQCGVQSNGVVWVKYGQSIATPNFLSAGYMGIISSTTLDQTSLIQTAMTNAVGENVGLWFPPGVYIYTGPTSNGVSLVGQSSDLVEFRNLAPLGVGARIDCSGSNPIIVRGITFTSPNTPQNSVNNASETSCCLRFQNMQNVLVDSNVFTDQFGPPALLRTIVGGRIINNRVYTCYKDGFHITGASTDIERINNRIEDGGDDCFPVIGYASGTGAGQPERILDLGNAVNGCKFSYAFHYAGSKSVQNIGCKVNGIIPASYSRPATQMSCAAMVIQVDSSFGTFGNENIRVVGLEADNCGRGAAPFTTITNAVYIQGGTGQTTRNIRFTNLAVRRSASAGLFANGVVAKGIEGLYLDGIDIINTADPNGYTGTAGAGQFTGITLQNVHNCDLRGSISDSGADGLDITASCTGRFDIDLSTYRINSGNKTGAARIVSVPASSLLSRLKFRLYIAEQANVSSSGTQYFLDRPWIISTSGITESMLVDLDAAVLGMAAQPFITNNTYTLPAITSSPMTYTNTSVAKQAVTINAGTATGLTVQRGQATSFGVAISIATGVSANWMTLAPGESIKLTYSSAGTLAIATMPAEGL